MSNPTIELGGGKWATKPTSLLGIENREWGMVPADFTVDRNSTATCVGSDGLIKTVQANEARIDYSNDPNGALLVEPQRTNLAIHSNDISKWVNVSGGTASTPIITPNYSISPDNSINACRVQLDLNSGTTISDISYNSLSVTNTSNLTYSIYIKSNTSLTYTIYIRVGGDVRAVDVTPEWQRFEINSAVEASFIQFGIRGDSYGGKTNSDSADIVVYGNQVEEASTASSYIPTNGTTVTRLYDKISIDNLISKGLIQATEGTVLFDFKEAEGLGNAIFEFNNATSGFLYYYGGTFDFKYQTQFAFDRSNVFNSNQKVAISYDTNGVKIYVGGQNCTKSNLTYEPDFNIDAIRSRISIREKNFIKGIKVFNQALTDQELIDLTTI